MKKLGIVTGAQVPVAHFAIAQSSFWDSDPNQSEVDIAITPTSMSRLHDRADNIAGTKSNESGLTRCSDQISIQVSTIETSALSRDFGLWVARYFNVGNLAEATFNRTRVTETGSDLSGTGDVALHGVATPVVLDLDVPIPPVADSRNRVHRVLLSMPRSTAPRLELRRMSPPPCASNSLSKVVVKQ